MSEDLIDVQIDGEWHKFPKGTRMIEACRAVGAEVPHYCYHPKLTSPGNCRMCLVEMGMPPRPRPGDAPAEPDEEGFLPISWMPRPAIACANTIAPNMGIRTKGPLTEECRRGVMEFLLANHPLDCPICDQAGECTLQEFSVEHGNGKSRFREQKVKKPKNVDIGPRIRLDDERCIMCSRCIRFTDEVADDPVLGFTERGSYTTLAVHPGKELANNYSLNTVDICPVGALTSNDFRFQMRTWFMKETKSIDTNCGTGCNITVSSREGKIYRITPRENNEVNSAWMPDSHRLNFHWINNPELRLTVPMVKEKDGDSAHHHRETSWTAAMDLAADHLIGLKGNEVAVIASARMTNEELFVTSALVKQLQTKLVDVVPRVGESDGYLISADRNPNTNGAKIVLGLNEPGSKLDDIKSGIRDGEIKALIVLQENIVDDAGFTADDLAKLDFLLVSYPIVNPAAELADVVLPGASWAEKSGTMINVSGRLQKLNKCMEGPGETREPWEIVRDLTHGISGGNGTHSVIEIFRQLANEVSEFVGLGWNDVGDQGLQLIETGETIPLLEKERERVEKGLIVG